MQEHITKTILKKLESIFICPVCGGSIKLADNKFLCSECNLSFPIINGIPRFIVDEKDLHNEEQAIYNQTNKYFGFEWEYFKDWGFIPDEKVNESDKRKYFGGLVSHRTKGFDAKCRLKEELKAENIILDAGCGNGRYTYEAAVRGNSTVIGVDLGTGSVESAFQNTKELENVLIIQANLHNLPFKKESFNASFSNGVLMHTGDAEKAFNEIARTLKPKASFVVNVYQKLNEHWEFNDKIFREVTTKLNIEELLELSKIIAKLGLFFENKGYTNELRELNKVIRIQGTLHHMFDWYSAPVATHHTYSELEKWFKNNKFQIIDKLPIKPEKPTGEWACNLKGIKE